MYDASNPRDVRKAQRSARAAEATVGRVLYTFLGDPENRAYIYNLLVRSHIFSSSFNGTALGTAFAEGERNIGLQLLLDIQRHCPDQYIQMMREAQDREVGNERRDSGPHRNNANGGRDDSALANVGDDYDPIAGDDAG